MRKLTLLGLAVIFTACSHTVNLRRTQTTVTYPDRLPGKTAVYFSPDITDRLLEVSSVGDPCDNHSYKMEFGHALTVAIQTGIETACQDVVVLTRRPSALEMKAEDIKILLVPIITSADADLTFHPVFLGTPNCKAAFQGSVTTQVIAADGKTFYSFTSSGIGLSNDPANCDEASRVLARATESGLQQIADNIAQSLNGSVHVREGYSQ